MTSDNLALPDLPSLRLSPDGTFFVTAGTYMKRHHFRSAERLDVLQRGLLRLAAETGWRLEAWAIFSNHYHLVGHAPAGSEGEEALRSMLGQLHERTGRWVGGKENVAAEKVWLNFWETRLTFEGSYFTRLRYVHQNAVKHGLVQSAADYPWCSAAWFERTASRKQMEILDRYKSCEPRVVDDYRPEPVGEGGREPEPAGEGMKAGE